MATSDGTTEPDSEPSRTLVTERRTVRRPVGNLYILAFLVVPVLLTALIGFTQQGAVEETLAQSAETRAVRARRSRGCGSCSTAASLTAQVPSGQRPDPSRRPSPASTGWLSCGSSRCTPRRPRKKACTDLQKKIDKATDKQRIPFAGTSSRLTSAGQQMMREVGDLLDACGLAVVTVGGHTDPRTSNGSTISLRAGAGDGQDPAPGRRRGRPAQAARIRRPVPDRGRRQPGRPGGQPTRFDHGGEQLRCGVCMRSSSCSSWWPSPSARRVAALVLRLVVKEKAGRRRRA